ncbi:hypothetical protein EYZ11_004361 [Aspergillus tanneri]|uniref:Carbohydrate kinase PfkB domain-containing protein n=1 Tax=Aspergillus tanneri TaxID=1220188 RepID=A0A4S3JL96_9EURO|nr:hypothetical protein EYZ11_004361 [Aspergillus tanneri]
MAGELDLSSRPSSHVEFCTMGMFILDDIDFGGTSPNVKNVIGGAASFAVVGARLVAGKDHSRSVSWIVDVGSDFPREILDVIRAWDTDCVIREDQRRLTTRAWNGYGPNEKRATIGTFYVVGLPNSLQDIPHERPIFVWEPVPDLCTPEEQERFFTAIKVVDVVSPNELELGMMFGQPGWNEESRFGRDIVKNIVESGIGPEGNGHLVIRAGKDGSYSYSRTQRIWLPAYHQANASGASAVVDPTGAGNSFLGALTQGGRYNNILEALVFATVAAGFVVEQIGVPVMSTSTEGRELWNKTEFTERVRLYTQRLYETVEESPQKHFQIN